MESPTTKTMQDVEATTLKVWLERGEALLIDVREPSKYAPEHIRDAQLLPLSTFDPARVHPLISDLHLRRAAIELGPEAELGRTPEYLLDWIRSWDETRPALISLTGHPEPTLFEE